MAHCQSEWHYPSRLIRDRGFNKNKPWALPVRSNTTILRAWQDTHATYPRFLCDHWAWPTSSWIKCLQIITCSHLSLKYTLYNLITEELFYIFYRTGLNSLLKNRTVITESENTGWRHYCVEQLQSRSSYGHKALVSSIQYHWFQ